MAVGAATLEAATAATLATAAAAVAAAIHTPTVHAARAVALVICGRIRSSLGDETPQVACSGELRSQSACLVRN